MTVEPKSASHIAGRERIVLAPELRGIGLARTWVVYYTLLGNAANISIQCAIVNYSTRSKCFRCQAPRPGMYLRPTVHHYLTNEHKNPVPRGLLESLLPRSRIVVTMMLLLKTSPPSFSCSEDSNPPSQKSFLPKESLNYTGQLLVILRMHQEIRRRGLKWLPLRAIPTWELGTGLSAAFC